MSIKHRLLHMLRMAFVLAACSTTGISLAQEAADENPADAAGDSAELPTAADFNPQKAGFEITFDDPNAWVSGVRKAPGLPPTYMFLQQEEEWLIQVNSTFKTDYDFERLKTDPELKEQIFDEVEFDLFAARGFEDRGEAKETTISGLPARIYMSKSDQNNLFTVAALGDGVVYFVNLATTSEALPEKQPELLNILGTIKFLGEATDKEMGVVGDRVVDFSQLGKN